MPALIALPTAKAEPSDADFIVKSTTFLVDGKPCRILNEQYANVATTKLQVVQSGTGTVIVDNIGSFNTTNSTISIVSFRPTGLLGGTSNVKISALPANQSAITPTLNYILKFDAGLSTINAVSTDADN